MNLLVAWKKVLLFGAFGAAGCLAGWLVGEPYLAVYDYIAKSAGAGQGPTLISKPTAPAADPPPLPSDLRSRVEAAGGKSGDVQISLIWFNTNDLDLHCVDPNGFEIYWKPDHRRSRSGGELDVDRNAGCNRLTAEPVENIYWAKGTAPMGRYRVYLNFYQRCPGAPNETTYKINVLHGGKRVPFEGTVGREDTPEGGPKRLIYEFQLEPKVELFAPAEFEVAPGSALKVPVAVRREFFQGKLDVRAESLPAGVTADTLTLQPNQSEGELTLKATDAVVLGKTKIKIVATGDGASGSADPELAVAKPAAQFSLWTVLAIGVWTALLAVGLCLALLAGQNKYLGKTYFAPGRVPLALVILGAVVAGFASGSIGQALFFVFLFVGVGKLGFLIGWVLLGGLLGWGVSFFIPNLDGKKAALAGLGGGFLGAVAFWVMSLAGDWIGRFGGAALLGFCIGLMVAVVEVAFRRAWLEVRFGAREVITVNLGPEPVKVGGDARACTVWARGAPEVALRYWIRDGKVYCEEVPTKREAAVADGDTRAAGNVTVVVRTGGTTAPPLAASRATAPPPIPAKPLAAPIPAKPQAAPAGPASPVPPAPAQSKPTPPDYDDGLPMPMGPPPTARPATTSILDIDDLRAASARPAAPKPAAPPAPAARSMAPPAPKPPVPAGGPKPGDPDACPTCGRKSPGRPGARYCMVCDKTF